MRKTPLTALIFLIVVTFILTACLNGAATSLKTEAIAQNSQSPAPTPENDFSIPDGWVLFPAPGADSKERSCANKTIDGERKVALDAGKLKISRYLYQPNEELAKLPENLQEIVVKAKIPKGYMYVESFAGGWLIGSDAGEWGGELYFLSADGSQKTDILKDNIRGIVKTGKDVFILSGMAHLGTDEGKIYKLSGNARETPKISLVTDLKTQPQQFVAETGESFLVALNDRVLRVKTSGDIETLKKTNFNSLYPNSMTLTPEGVIYVGMRLFVVRFVPAENGYREEWLVAPDCLKFAEKDFGCVCQNAK